jgi:hypothetical protein
MINTYLVISHEEGDILKIQEELLNEGGDSHIPSRVCSSPDLILESGTHTLFSLTKEEAEELSNDPRVKFVHKHEEEEDEDDGKSVTRGQIGINNDHPDWRTFVNNEAAESATSYEDYMTKADMIGPAFQLHSIQGYDLFKQCGLTDLYPSVYDPKYEVPRLTDPVMENLPFRDFHKQADGEGVDIVVADRPFGYEYNPQFEGKNGYRFKMINWWKAAGYPDDDYWVQYYDDYDFNFMGPNSHGLNVAEAAAGLEGGFASGAHIYNATPMLNLVGPDGEYVHPNRILLLVLEWHKRKFQEGGSRRPTVLVCSRASRLTTSSQMPLRGRYRGQEWTYNGETEQELTYKYGLRFGQQNMQTGGNHYRDTKGEVREKSMYMRMLYDAGVPVVLSCGNAGIEFDHPTNNDWVPEGLEHIYVNDDNPNLDHYEGNMGLDWDNYVVFENKTFEGEPAEIYYNRAGDPWFNGAILAGELEMSREGGNNPLNLVSEHVKSGSGRGPAVACYAHTFNKITDDSRTYEYDYDSPGYPVSGLQGMDITEWDFMYRPSRLDPNYRTKTFHGTSAAAPTIAGLIACYLEKEPDLTPREVHRKLQEESGRDANNRRHAITDNSIATYRIYEYANDPMGLGQYPIPYNPYGVRDNVEISGNIDLHSSTYLENSDLSVDSQVINHTLITNFLTQSTLTVENNNMTTENNTTTVSLQVKDENNVNVTTDNLVINFAASDGVLGDVVSEGNGLYSTTFFAPPTGSGSIELKAKIYGQEIQETVTVYYQGEELQQPPAVTTLVPDNLVSATAGDTLTISLVENTGANQKLLELNISSNFGPCTVTPSAGTTPKLNIVQQTEDRFDLHLSDNPDYESYQSLQCDVDVTDQLGNVTTIKLDLSIVDADDVGPVFSNGLNPTATSFNEHTKINEVVYTASATDDSGGSVTYSLPIRGQSVSIVSQSDLFVIDATTGELTLEQDVSYEDYTAIQAIIIAADSLGNTSRQTVTIPVNNVDEIAPTISSGSTGAPIVEGTSMVVFYMASAYDVGDNSDGIVTFSLDADYEDGALLTIQADNGGVALLNPVLKSDYDEIKFRFFATDSAGNVSSRVVTTSVVLPADVEAPVITSSNTASPIVEGSGSGQAIYTAVATDNRSTPVFSLSGDSDSDVSISADGIVTLNVNPDYSVKTQHVFTVIATDAAGNASNKTVTLEILNVDTAAPVFSESSYSATIQEGSPDEWVFLFTATAVDSNEATNGVVTYSLDVEGHNDVGSYNELPFIILTDSGRFGWKPAQHNKPASYALHGNLNIKVVATDESGNSSSVPVYLTVEEQVGKSLILDPSPNGLYLYTGSDNNNTIEQLESGDWNVELGLLETSYGENILAIQSSTAFYGTANWEIVNPDFSNDEITIGSTTAVGTSNAAVLVKNNNINAAADAEHNFTIRFTDGDLLPTDINVKITIINADSTAPEISTLVEPVQLDQNGDFDTGVLFQATSDDPDAVFKIENYDSSYNQDIGGVVYKYYYKYIFDAGDARDAWGAQVQINSTTGEVSWRNTSGLSMVDCPTPSLGYTISATDPFNNKSTFIVTHNVTELAEVAFTGEVKPVLVGSTPHPLFSSYPLYNVAEQTPAGTEVFTLNAARSDNDDIIDNALNNVVYSMATNDDFEIDATTGVVTTKREHYDFEDVGAKLTSYEVSVATNYSSGTNFILIQNQNVNEGQVWTINDSHHFQPIEPSAGDVIISNVSDLVSDLDNEGLIITVDTTSGGSNVQPIWEYDADTDSIKSLYTISSTGMTYSYGIRINATDSSGVSSSRTGYFTFQPAPLMEKIIVPATRSGSGGQYTGYHNYIYGSALGEIYAIDATGADPQDTSSSIDVGVVTGIYFHNYMADRFHYRSSASPMSTSWISLKYSKVNTDAQNKTFYRGLSNYSSYNGFYWTMASSGTEADWFSYNVNNMTTFTVKWY